MERFYCITGYEPHNEKEFLSRCIKLLDDGFKLIQLRSKHFSTQQFQSIAYKLIDISRNYNAKILINTDMLVDDALCGADGIHCTMNYFHSLHERPYPDKIVAASCHTRDDLLKAQVLNFDFVCLSPVKPTSSHPGSDTIGWEGFHELIKGITMPVYALGGVGQEDLDEAVSHGAQGIAAISAFWNSVS